MRKPKQESLADFKKRTSAKKRGSNELLNTPAGPDVPKRRGRKWTPEQKAAQAVKIKEWAPWKSSTGPKSKAGKACAARNSLQHGLRGAKGRKLFEALVLHQAYLKFVQMSYRFPPMPEIPCKTPPRTL